MCGHAGCNCTEPDLIKSFVNSVVRGGQRLGPEALWTSPPLRFLHQAQQLYLESLELPSHGSEESKGNSQGLSSGHRAPRPPPQPHSCTPTPSGPLRPSSLFLGEIPAHFFLDALYWAWICFLGGGAAS